MARRQGSSSDVTGPRIREAALRLIARHGFAAVTMRQLAGEVGLQAGALYLYYPDKQSMLFALLKDHMDELLAAWSALVLPQPPAERLEAFVRFHLRFHLARPEAVFISYMELRNLTEANFAVIEGLRNCYEAVLERILADGQETGAFQVPDGKLATKAVLAMLTGVTTWYREDGRLSRGRVERIYWNMVRRAVGG